MLYGNAKSAATDTKAQNRQSNVRSADIQGNISLKQKISNKKQTQAAC